MQLAEIAPLARARVIRDAAFGDLGLIGPASRASLVYAVDEHSVRRLATHPAAAVITTSALVDAVPGDMGVAASEDPERDFYAVHRALLERTDFYWKDFATLIDPSANVHERAFVAPRNVRIGARVVIEPNATILGRVTIDDDAVIRAGAILGSEGFEFKGPAMRQGRASRASRDFGARNERVPHAGSVHIGKRVEIQAGTAVDLGLFKAPTSVGDDTKIDNLVHIAHSARIGRNCLIAASTMIAGSTTIGDEVWIGPGSVISSGLLIGDRAAIVIGSTITRDVESGARIASDLKTFRLP
jgi:UDP-3-O-[3-hydroxymyristoyl] glucosamine N-acyltransferase